MYTVKWLAGLLSVVIALAAPRCMAEDVVRYGNSDPFTGNVPIGSLMLPGYLFGPAISVSQPITLTGVGVIFNGSGWNARVGVYADDTGFPGDLLAQTGDFAVTSSGRVETPVLSPVALSPGKYWFEAVYDSVAIVGVDGPSLVPPLTPPPVASVPMRGTVLNFSDPLPPQFPAATSGLAFDLNYYLIGNDVPEPSALVLLATVALSFAAYFVWRQWRTRTISIANYQRRPAHGDRLSDSSIP